MAKGSQEEDSEQLWTIAERGETVRGQILKAQDVIKLGRVIFKVSQVRGRFLKEDFNRKL